MSGKLPLNLDDLLHQRTVEGDRIEYKAGWNPDAIVKTLCAFGKQSWGQPSKAEIGQVVLVRCPVLQLRRLNHRTSVATFTRRLRLPWPQSKGVS